MDFAIYYTLGAILLYGAASWLLNRIEEARGERFKYRNAIFFIIIFVMAMFVMEVINPPEVAVPPSQNTESIPPVR
jgi:hypothetical protein